MAKRENIFRCFLILEAAVCVALCFVKASLSGAFTAVFAFPFEQIGLALRAISLSGALGNAAALALYILISLLPAGALLLLRKRRRLYVEDWLLAVLSAFLFAALYLMVNPVLIPQTFGKTASGALGKAILGGTAYSIIIGYLILRALRLFKAGTAQKLGRYLAIMLGVLNVLLVYMAFGGQFAALLDSIAALRAGNVGTEDTLGPSYVFLALQYAVNALPYVLDVFVVFAAMKLLREFRRERYSEESVAAAERLSRFCVITLTATTLTNIGFNLLQLLFAGSLRMVNGSVQVPVFSILFVLAALLLTRFFIDGKALKDENDSFI
ncbi:MAG: hypothetical protein LBM18_05225 [Oscillospiraceae bacterium]|jgi:hypothetical protein|nr:hypothetical protein [Oscillospiraceae bacterium]